jgi:hypothetical protein
VAITISLFFLLLRNFVRNLNVKLNVLPCIISKVVTKYKILSSLLFLPIRRVQNGAARTLIIIIRHSVRLLCMYDAKRWRHRRRTSSDPYNQEGQAERSELLTYEESL